MFISLDVCNRLMPLSSCTAFIFVHRVCGFFLTTYFNSYSCYKGARCSSVVRAFAHGAMGRRIDPSGVDPMSYFLFQLMLHEWCNKGRGMCYPVCGMVHIKEPLLLIGKSSPYGGTGFPLAIGVVLYHMSDTI